VSTTRAPAWIRKAAHVAAAVLIGLFIVPQICVAAAALAGLDPPEQHFVAIFGLAVGGLAAMLAAVATVVSMIVEDGR
jgi:hypothetical protein